MFYRLIRLEWKSFFRSASVGKSIALKAFMGFLVLYFGLSFLLLGMMLPRILWEHFPDQEPVQVVNSFLAIWLLGELFMRFMLQNLPVLHIKPLLVQHIKRSNLVHFVLMKSVLHWLNLFTPIVFVPFIVISLGDSSFSAMQLLGWLFMLLSLVLVLNYLNFIIQKKFADNIKALIPLIVILVVLGGLEYFNVFSSTAFLGTLFDYVLEYPVLALVPLVLLAFVYRANFVYLKGHLYLDTALRDQSIQYKETDLSWTNRFGAAAPFLQLDMRLIRRNKRPRSVIMLSLFFVLYGLLFYPNPAFSNSTMLVLVGVFMTGIFVINFGQFIPAWDGSYFSMLMAQDIPMKLYLDSKAILMYISVIICAALTLPYAYFGWNILLVNLACAVYNMGVNIPVVLYFGAFNKKKIELDKAQFFNYQGTGLAQWIVGIPLILLPMLIWGVVNVFTDQLTASAVLFGLGVLGLLLKNVLMKGIVDAYKARKHVMLEGFKQQG